MSERTLIEVYQQAREKLRAAHIDNADLDARLLCEWATETTRLDAITKAQTIIQNDKIAKLNDAIARRINCEPVYRIIGVREFYGLNFFLSPDTLEPRADTETLVDMVVPILKNIVDTKGSARFVDMGTGSGAIALSLLTQVKQAQAVGVDISFNALETAFKNAYHLGVENHFTILVSNWFEALNSSYDLIVSNPPYIPEKDIKDLSIEVQRFDPLRALDGGNDGLDFYRKLAQESAYYLNKNGYVAVEIGIHQEHDVIALFESQSFICLEMRKDLSGIIRALLFIHSPKE